jgi:hypothetical protein
MRQEGEEVLFKMVAGSGLRYWLVYVLMDLQLSHLSSISQTPARFKTHGFKLLILRAMTLDSAHRHQDGRIMR